MKILGIEINNKIEVFFKIQISGLITHQISLYFNCSSSDCETPAEEPKLQMPLADRMVKPYMGFYDEKLWDKKGFLGSLVSPIEHVYFEFVTKRPTKA